MIITFYSNYYNHHQAALCEALSSIDGLEFYFVETEPMESFRSDMGWGDIELPGFVISAFESQEKKDMALELAGISDAVIIGSAPEWYVEKRIEEGGLVFRYTERPMKEGWIKMFIPRLTLKFYRLHFRNRKRNVYLLGASAYAAYDYSLMFSYPGKCLKFGYFPKGEDKSFEEICRERSDGSENTKDTEVSGRVLKILWTGRLLKLKRCDLLIRALGELSQQGYSFQARIVGEGEEKAGLEKLVDELKLRDKVSFCGFVSPEENRALMRRSDIYVMTSNFLEGWGSVIYEALSEGCAVIASHACGCSAWLVKRGVTGLVYKSGSVKSLKDKLRSFLTDDELRDKCQRGAYRQMTELWNPTMAARRLFETAGSLLAGKGLPEYEDGPLSRAEIMRNNWYTDRADL